MMLRKVLIQIIRGDQLQYCIAEKLESLVRAKCQVRVPDAPIGERPRQQSDVPELHADGLLKLCELLQHVELFYPVTVALRLLLLKGERREVHPDLKKGRVVVEESSCENVVRHLKQKKCVKT